MGTSEAFCTSADGGLGKGISGREAVMLRIRAHGSENKALVHL